MKILIDTKVLGRGQTTGIPGYAYYLIDHLLATSKTDEFILLSTGLRAAPLPNHWQSNPRVRVVRSRIPNKLLDLCARLLHRPKWGKKTKADIIISPHFNILAPEQTPRIITFHDLSFLHHSEFFSAKDQSWHALQNYRKQLDSVGHIVAVSEFTKNDLLQTEHINPKKISVIYPGISPEFSPLDPHDPALLSFQKKHDLQNPFFLYLGSINSRKNLIALIRAFNTAKADPLMQKYESKLGAYELILAGTPGYGAAEILHEAEQSPYKNTIRFLSGIKNEERVFLYNSARAFIFPSFFEGFGFPPLEAQACGIPVIASNRTALFETLSTSAICIDPWRIDQLARAMLQIENDGRLRHTTILAGLANSKRFNWHTTAENTLSLCKKLLA